MAGTTKPIPDGYNAVMPYLIVRDAAAAIEFYKNAFGAVERLRMDGPHGKIGHAELQIGSSVIMLADEFPEMNVKGPGAFGGSPVAIYLYVDDVDDRVRRATDAGARTVRPVDDMFYGDRMGTIEDPFGHIWHLSTHVEDVSADELRRRARQAMKPSKPDEEHKPQA